MNGVNVTLLVFGGAIGGQMLRGETQFSVKCVCVSGAREAMKNHGYDKERALTLTDAELDELAKNVLNDKKLIKSSFSVKSSYSVASVKAASTTYFSSIHSIHSFDG